MLSNFKKELVLQFSKIYPIIMKKGLSKGFKLYGNIFYNRREETITDEEKFYQSLRLKNKIVIEVGAHIGIDTLYLSQKVNDGKIYAFEPNPQSYYFLKKNIKKNSIKNAVLINAGVSDADGNLRYVSNKYNSAKGSFINDKQDIIRKRTSPYIEINIPTMTLDKFVEEYKLSYVDFIKIDTEGFEPFVIKGMSNILKTYSPVIYFEVHGLNIEQKHNDLKQIYEYLTPLSFSIFKNKTKVNSSNLLKFNGGGFVASKKTQSN